MAGVPENQKIRLVRNSSQGQLPAELSNADLAAKLQSMVIGVGFGGAQPAPAGALLPFVLLAYLAEGGAVIAWQMLFNSNHRQPGTVLPGETNRLGQRAASSRRVVIGNHDAAEHVFSVAPVFRSRKHVASSDPSA